MIIAHNLSATNTYNQMDKTNFAASKSYEKLSSGLAINRASDDAAGLSISEKMRSQIRGLNQSTRNIESGISYVQVADGALGEVSSMLHRIRELAIQAANGTLSSDDRTDEEKRNKVDPYSYDRIAINNEIEQIKDEMSRIFSNTEFNTEKIWQTSRKFLSSTEKLTKQTVISAPTISFKSINTGHLDINNDNNIKISNGYIYFNATEDDFCLYYTALDGTRIESSHINYDPCLYGDYDIDLAEVFADANSTYGLDWKGNLKFNINIDATKDEVITALNNNSIYIYPKSSQRAKLTAGSGITIGTSDFNNSTQSNFFQYNALVASGLDFDGYDDNFIDFVSFNNAADAGKENTPFEFTFNMRNIGEVKARATSSSHKSYSCEGEAGGRWWLYQYNSSSKKYDKPAVKVITSPSSSDYSIIDFVTEYPSGNLIDDTVNGGYITIPFNMYATTPFTTPNGGTQTSVGSFYITIPVDGSDTRDTLKTKIQSITSLDFDSNDTSTDYYYYYGSRTAHDSTQKSSHIEYDWETVLEFSDWQDVDLKIHSGANSWQEIDITHEGLTIEKLGLDKTNVLTREAAESAIVDVDYALEVISRQRSNFGALQNRMEHALQINKDTSENIQSAESRIRDTDMAEEMMDLTKSNILQQSSQALLTQAMQRPKQVLQLLQQ
ncbi:MAG: hypothetical protein MJ245_04105 [Clostridia bacterium]|nr:hypothetical protein [Clostridia bacterium]